MGAIYYHLMEVLTRKSHIEVKKIASSSNLSNKYFYRYCDMVIFISSFTPDEWGSILSTHPLSLAALENGSLVEKAGITKKCPYFHFVWTYFREFLVHWWGWKSLPK